MCATKKYVRLSIRVSLHNPVLFFIRYNFIIIIIIIIMIIISLEICSVAETLTLKKFDRNFFSCCIRVISNLLEFEYLYEYHDSLQTTSRTCVCASRMQDASQTHDMLKDHKTRPHNFSSCKYIANKPSSL